MNTQTETQTETRTRLTDIRDAATANGWTERNHAFLHGTVEFTNPERSGDIVSVSIVRDRRTRDGIRVDYVAGYPDAASYPFRGPVLSKDSDNLPAKARRSNAACAVWLLSNVWPEPTDETVAYMQQIARWTRGF